MVIKELRFETSKGKFFMVENNTEVLRQVPYDFCDRIGLLSGFTEEQAKEIVDGGYCSTNGCNLYEDYQNENNVSYTALDSLHSLIKSKGWYLSNPVSLEREKVYRDLGDTFTANGILKSWQQAESRTLHNPVIFKIK